MQIIPAIDLRGGKCVRLRQGDYAQESVFGDNPVEMARRWESEGAERLHLVDLDGARDGRPVNGDSIRAITAALKIPCQLGGGIRDESSMRMAFDDLGVARVIVGTQALKQPEWFRQMSEKFPGKLLLGLDARNSMVATEGWLDVSQTSALELAQQYARLKLAGIIYTNIANDGMMTGVDQGTLADLVRLSELGLPVIASGGVTTLADVAELTRLEKDHPHLSSAIVGRALYEGTISLSEAVALGRWNAEDGRQKTEAG